MHGETAGTESSVATAPRRPEGHCQWDGCRPLSGRQRRFATEECKNAWWERERPRKERRNYDLLTPRIYALYKDGVYRSDREGASLLGALEGSLAMRRRESGYPLTHKRGRGWAWHSRRRVGSREMEHALIVEQA